MPKLSKRDIEMMKMTCQMEIALVADRLDMKRGAIHSRYSWLRKKRIECQTFINTLNGFESKCPKLRKLLTSSMRSKETEQNE